MWSRNKTEEFKELAREKTAIVEKYRKTKEKIEEGELDSLHRLGAFLATLPNGATFTARQASMTADIPVGAVAFYLTKLCWLYKQYVYSDGRSTHFYKGGERTSAIEQGSGNLLHFKTNDIPKTSVSIGILNHNLFGNYPNKKFTSVIKDEFGNEIKLTVKSTSRTYCVIRTINPTRERVKTILKNLFE